MKYVFPLYDLWDELTAVLSAVIPFSYNGATEDGYPIDQFGNTPEDLALHWIENVLKRVYGINYVRDTGIVVTWDEEAVLNNLDDWPLYDFAVRIKGTVTPQWDIDAPVIVSRFGTDLMVEVI